MSVDNLVEGPRTSAITSATEPDVRNSPTWRRMRWIKAATNTAVSAAIVRGDIDMDDTSLLAARLGLREAAVSSDTNSSYDTRLLPVLSKRFMRVCAPPNTLHTMNMYAFFVIAVPVPPNH